MTPPLLLALLLAAPPVEAAQALGDDAPPAAAQRYEIGRRHYLAGDFAQAAHEFSSALAIHPDPKLAYNLARATERLGRLQEAIDAYQRYLELAPEADDRGAVDKLVTHLRGELERAPKVRLTGYLVCRRHQADGTWRAVPACDGAALTRGDQVKIGFEVDAAARVYVMSHNEKGQVQVLFPAPGVSNDVEPGTRYFLPRGNQWLTLDATPATERVRIVAARAPVPELEALRAWAEPAKDPVVGERALAFAGRVATRGFERPKEAIEVSPEGADVRARGTPTLPVIQRGAQVAAVELTVVHR